MTITKEAGRWIGTLTNGTMISSGSLARLESLAVASGEQTEALAVAVAIQTAAIIAAVRS